MSTGRGLRRTCGSGLQVGELRFAQAVARLPEAHDHGLVRGRVRAQRLEAIGVDRRKGDRRRLDRLHLLFDARRRTSRATWWSSRARGSRRGHRPAGQERLDRIGRVALLDQRDCSGCRRSLPDSAASAPVEDEDVRRGDGPELHRRWSAFRRRRDTAGPAVELRADLHLLEGVVHVRVARVRSTGRPWDCSGLIGHERKAVTAGICRSSSCTRSW